MAALGRVARSEHTVYLVGGATAVLEGWRGSSERRRNSGHAPSHKAETP